jgi:hypothetical protein
MRLNRLFFTRWGVEIVDPQGALSDPGTPDIRIVRLRIS